MRLVLCVTALLLLRLAFEAVGAHPNGAAAPGTPEPSGLETVSERVGGARDQPVSLAPAGRRIGPEKPPDPSDRVPATDPVQAPPEGGRLTVRVLDVDRVSGAIGAWVVIRPVGGGRLGEEGDRTSGPIDGCAIAAFQGLPLNVDLLAVATMPPASPSLPVPFRLSDSSVPLEIELTLRPPGRLEVRALDESGRALTVEAVVRGESVYDRMTPTDQGACSDDLPAGRGRVDVWTPVHSRTSTAIEIEEGRTTVLELVMSRGVSIGGRVVDAEQRPVAGARVVAGPRRDRWSRPDAERVVICDDSGAFRIQGLEHGPVWLRAERIGEGAGTWECTPEQTCFTAPGDGVRLTLIRSMGFTIRVLDPDGSRTDEESSDFEVALSTDTYAYIEANEPRLNSGPRPRLRCGEFGLGGLPGDREVPVTLYVRGFRPIHVVVPPRPGCEVDLGEVRLEPGREIAGFVLGPEGEPVKDAAVRGDARGDPVRTDVAGRFVLPAQPLDRVRLSVEASGFAGLELDAAGPSNGEPVRIELRREAATR